MYVCPQSCTDTGIGPSHRHRDGSDFTDAVTGLDIHRFRDVTGHAQTQGWDWKHTDAMMGLIDTMKPRHRQTQGRDQAH